MKEIYCRIITAKYTSSAEAQVKAFIHNALCSIGCETIVYTPFIPYWKAEGFGELSFHFSTQESVECIQALFADSWEYATADISRSQIYCPDVMFLWISS